MQKRWNILQANPDHIDQLHAELKINRTLCRILVQRGIYSFDAAKNYFRPQLSHLHSPWLMKDMEPAVKRIIQAIHAKEKILVFGDYDVDGTTSVASMLQFLQKLTPFVDYYIPHRYKEGYGISLDGIHHARDNDFTLIVSLDCGIKSAELIGYAKSIGIEFIVCDHHLPDEILPPAVAILNPKQKDCNYPFKELCGCGVGFKLMMALAERLYLPDESYLQFLDLVATAIAADIVPITGENRVLAYYGLLRVNENPCPGIKALMHLAAVNTAMTINSLVFVIAPRVNAAGRMDNARKAVELFTAPDFQRALATAKLLHEDNTERKLADTTITEEALELISTDEVMLNKRTTVVFKETWHKGVVGIVASRLIEKYYRPTIVLTQSGEIVSGSARSVSGFNLYEAVHACKEHLLGYGGHFAAAGMTLLPENIQKFASKFEEVVAATIHQDSLVPEIIIDAVLELKNLTSNFYSILTQMEPFGPENMRPVFLIKNLKNIASKIVKENHIRFVMQQEMFNITGIGFNMAHKFPLLELSALTDIVCTIDMNDFNGDRSLQMKVLDFRLSE